MAACRFSDIVKQQLTGPEQDFPDWMRTFRAATKATGIKFESMVGLLVAWCEGACRDAANDFVAKYEQEHPLRTSRSAGSADSAEARENHFKQPADGLGGGVRHFGLGIDGMSTMRSYNYMGKRAARDQRS